MKDIEKTSVDRVNSRKRMRRRRRFMNVYIVIVLLLVAVIGFAASYTFLFNIGEIRVSGESAMYSAEKIVDVSGIHEGDNLLRIDTKKSAEKILKDLLYVETAEVSRDFPSSLEIKVTQCVPTYNISCGDKTLLISRQGKILAENTFTTDGLPVIYGYTPADNTPGAYISSEDEFKKDALNAVISSIAKIPDTSISSINMEDEHAIVVNYKNGIEFRMGNWNDADYKFNMAETVMNDPSVKGKKGFLTMIGTHQCSFRTTDEPVAVPGNIEPKKKKDGDENTTEPSAEINPEQEQIFSDYNKRAEEGDSSGFFDDDENQQETEPSSESENYDDNGGYYDSEGYYHDQWGGYYDSYGNYYDSYGNLVSGAWSDDGSYQDW